MSENFQTGAHLNSTSLTIFAFRLSWKSSCWVGVHPMLAFKIWLMAGGERRDFIVHLSVILVEKGETSSGNEKSSFNSKETMIPSGQLPITHLTPLKLARQPVIRFDNLTQQCMNSSLSRRQQRALSMQWSSLRFVQYRYIYYSTALLTFLKCWYLRCGGGVLFLHIR